MMAGVSRDSPELIVQVSGGEEGPAGKALIHPGETAKAGRNEFCTCLADYATEVC